MLAVEVRFDAGLPISVQEGVLNSRLLTGPTPLVHVCTCCLHLCALKALHLVMLVRSADKMGVTRLARH